MSLEQEVLARDKACVYCGVAFAVPAVARGTRPSWEHIVNDAAIITRGNIARCCVACNASKGTQGLGAWLRSAYCKRKGITESRWPRLCARHLSRALGDFKCTRLRSFGRLMT